MVPGREADSKPSVILFPWWLPCVIWPLFFFSAIMKEQRSIPLAPEPSDSCFTETWCSHPDLRRSCGGKYLAPGGTVWLRANRRLVAADAPFLPPRRRVCQDSVRSACQLRLPDGCRRRHAEGDITWRSDVTLTWSRGRNRGSMGGEAIGCSGF